MWYRVQPGLLYTLKSWVVELHGQSSIAGESAFGVIYLYANHRTCIPQNSMWT